MLTQYLITVMQIGYKQFTRIGLIIIFSMKPQTVLLILAISVYVSCQRTRMLQKDGWGDYKVNCKNFDEAKGTCLQCFEGCTKWENICVKVVQHCAKWNDQGNCTDCQEGYGDQSNKSVDDSCPKQQGNNTNNTETGNNGTVSSQNGNSSIDENCQCHSEKRICIDCFSGFYLNANATCQELPQNCTAANTNGQCTGCIQGFRVQNGQCVQQVCDKSLCAAFNSDQSECISCPQRSYLESGCCYQVNGYCSEWVETTGQCTACYQGYIINKDNSWECIKNTSS